MFQVPPRDERPANCGRCALWTGRPVRDSERVSDRARRRIRLAARAAAKAAHPSFAGWVRLASSGWYLQVDDLLNDPAAATLMAEDAAWYFAVIDWRDRRPAVWRRPERRSWLAEEKSLAQDAAALVRASSRLRTLRPVREASQ